MIARGCPNQVVGILTVALVSISVPVCAARNTIIERTSRDFTRGIIIYQFK